VKYRQKQDPIPPLTMELVTVYRCGKAGRRYRSRRWAYLAVAYAAFRWAHPCTCEGDVGFFCDQHGEEWEAYEDKVVQRLARFLRYRDGRRMAVKP
jgi:hypothetical protein